MESAHHVEDNRFFSSCPLIQLYGRLLTKTSRRRKKKEEKRNHIFGHFGAVGGPRLSNERAARRMEERERKKGSIIKVMLLIIGWLLRSDQSDLCVFRSKKGGRNQRRGRLKSITVCFNSFDRKYFATQGGFLFISPPVCVCLVDWNLPLAFCIVSSEMDVNWEEEEADDSDQRVNWHTRKHTTMLSKEYKYSSLCRSTGAEREKKKLPGQRVCVQVNDGHS